MNRRKACLLLAASPAAAVGFQANWTTPKERPWIGPEFWANPLQDWRVRSGRIECFVAGGDRNVYLLTHELSAKPLPFSMRVRIGRLEEDSTPLVDGFAGFRFGIRSRYNDYRDSAVYGFGMNAGMAGDGRIFIGKLDPSATRFPRAFQDVDLLLEATPTGNTYTLNLSAIDKDGVNLAHATRTEVPADWVRGGVALVCHSGEVEDSPDPSSVAVHLNGLEKRNTARKGNVRFWFRDWKVSGPKVEIQEDRAFGPILFAMYTLSRRVMKLTAQMAPLGNDPEPVRLEALVNNQWKQIASSKIDPLSRIAHFRVPNWRETEDTPYRVAYKMGRDYYFDGVIKKDPVEKPKIVVAGCSCNNDLGFPHADVARSLRSFHPDFAAFVGDQIYERVAGYGIQRQPIEPAVLDYLRKWYLFGWAYRDLLRETPSVCMTDDHDMYHGNIWGAGGRHAEGTGFEGQDSGGYMQPAAWVNVVQRCQASHLPDPVDPTPVEQGITVYYTDLRIGGISFAILEDRKWKSPPKQLLPQAKIVNGWAQNPEYNAAKEGDVAGAQLLGPRQLKFLDQWSADWSGGVWMKAVISQTLFANVATLPAPANTDNVTPKLPILKPTDYPEGEIKVADHDSNAWPQSGRNAALRAFRRACAVHITGDQHLGSTVQYGVEDWNDASFAICTPAISNIFPRRWYPPQPGANPLPHSPRNTGEFLDGFGNKVTVHAVFNPAQTQTEYKELFDRSPGYGIIEFERATRKISLAIWPRLVDPTVPGAKPAPGWPVVIDQAANGLPKSGWTLDTIKLGERKNLCVQIADQNTGEILYTVRISGDSFTPPVRKEGVYTVKLFDPDGTYSMIQAVHAKKSA